MSAFKAKMHKIRFSQGLPTYPTGGAYSAYPGLIAVFKRIAFKRREGEGGEAKGK